MKLTLETTKYYKKNKKISKTQGILFMALGFVILGFVVYGTYLFSINVNAMYEDWNSEDYSSDYDYSYQSPYEQVYNDCLAECINDYGNSEGYYRDNPSKKITVSVNQMGNGNYICECTDSINYDGWTMEYGYE